MSWAENAFEGASQTYRLEQKGLKNLSADRASLYELTRLRQRSHHLCRNNPLAIAARNRCVAHWIANGISVSWDDKIVQAEWDKWAKSPSIDGWGTFANLQNLWGLGFFESGEAPTRMVIRENAESIVPLKLQVFEAEQLDIAYFQSGGTRYGITFDEDGKPITFHFWKRHPNDIYFSEASVRMPVDARDVCHIFQRDRPGQWRGIPKVTPCILPLYEMDELMDATLVRQKLAQAGGWIITKTNEGAMPLVGSVESDTSELSPGETSTEDRRIQKILPGGIHYLEADEKFEFASIDDIGANLTVFLEHQIRLCASAMDVTYEQITGDLSKINFSSIRAGLIEFRKKVALTQKLNFINLGIYPVTQRFKELGTITGGDRFANAKCKFILPKVDWVDPLKDIQADLLEVRSGFSTMQAKLAEREVDDFQEHITQIMKEQGLEVILDSNPKHNTMDVKSITDQKPAKDKQKSKSSTTKTKGAVK